MLSAVLRSDVAVEVSVKIMNSFVEMIKRLLLKIFLEKSLKYDTIKKLTYYKAFGMR